MGVDAAAAQRAVADVAATLSCNGNSSSTNESSSAAANSSSNSSKTQDAPHAECIKADAQQMEIEVEADVMPRGMSAEDVQGLTWLVCRTEAPNLLFRRVFRLLYMTCRYVV